MPTKIPLNLNESPVPPDTAAIKAAQAACAEANRYPDFDGASLRQAIAKQFDVTPDWVIVGNGSVGVIQQTMIASGQKEIAFCWPSFDAFPTVAEGLGMKVRKVPLAHHACDLDALAKAVTAQTSVVIVCTPNNPTGGTVTHTALAAFLATLPPRVIAIIDEAYGEFVREDDAVRAVELVQAYPNVVLTRTFSKFHGMAGFRVGYGVAQPELATRIFAAGVPFSIPLPAQAAALAVLERLDTAQARVDALIAERHRLATALQDLGVEVIEGHGNFVWLPLGEIAESIVETIATYDIVIKKFMPHGARITVGTEEQNDKLLAVWQKAISPLLTKK